MGIFGVYFIITMKRKVFFKANCKVNEEDRMKQYCIEPGCPMIADADSKYCSIHNGKAKRDKYGFIIWTNTKKKENTIKEEKNVV